MSTVSFALKAEYEGTVDLNADLREAADDPSTVEERVVPVFQGGVLSIDGSRSFDTAEALEAGNGVITVEETDTALVELLDYFGPLKRVPTPDGATALTSYESASLVDLRAEAKRRGIEGAARAPKAAVITALVEYDERAAAGNPDVNDGTTVDELTTNDDTAGNGTEG